MLCGEFKPWDFKNTLVHLTSMKHELFRLPSSIIASSHARWKYSFMWNQSINNYFTRAVVNHCSQSPLAPSYNRQSFRDHQAVMLVITLILLGTKNSRFHKFLDEPLHESINSSSTCYHVLYHQQRKNAYKVPLIDQPQDDFCKQDSPKDKIAALSGI